MAALTGTNTYKSAPYIIGTTQVVTGTYELAAALAAADTITWTDLLPQEDITILEVAVTTPDLDSSGTDGTLDIGDGTDADGYVDGAKLNIPASDAATFTTVGQGALIGTTVSDKRNVVATVAGSPNETSGTVTVKVIYACGEV